MSSGTRRNSIGITNEQIGGVIHFSIMLGQTQYIHLSKTHIKLTKYFNLKTLVYFRFADVRAFIVYALSGSLHEKNNQD